MTYKDKYSERIEIPEEDLSNIQRMVISGLIREGEFTTREYFIELFEEEISRHKEDSTDALNSAWIDGVNYCIHILKETKAINE